MTLSQIQSPCSTWTAWTSTSWQRTWLVCKLNPCWWAGIGSNRDYFIVIYPTAHSRCNDSWFLTLPRAQNRLPKLIKRELAEVRLVTHGQTASAISIVSRDPANCFSSDSAQVRLGQSQQDGHLNMSHLLRPNGPTPRPATRGDTWFVSRL